MGKTTGFLEYARRSTPQRDIALRLRDWDEVTLPQPQDVLREQAARCMDCGVPFCHANFTIGTEPIGCPLANLVPEVNDLVYRGDIAAAYERLSRTNPFPEITGRVCPALCEGSCTLGQHERPVAVKDIERYVADAQLAAGAVYPPKPAAATGYRVAVVGSGPAGLACADLLNRLGHKVVVYERAERAGGLLMFGIPTMKLDKAVVAARVGLLEEAGVHFVTGCEVGAQLPFARLQSEFDAVVLCIGAGAERKLAVPGAGAAGVVSAMQYLPAATRAQLAGQALPPELDAAGKRVVVVGGGDTGADCVATALRQGAKGVLQLEIQPPPPDERDEQSNPWPLWPRVQKTQYAHAEAAETLGGDVRRYETTVQQVLQNAAGCVRAVQTTRVQWRPGDDGRPAPHELLSTLREEPAELVVTAMGFTGPEQALPRGLGLACTPRGAIHTGEGFETGLAGVYCAGDARRGPSLVVWAMQEGRAAAQSCHAALCRRAST